MKKNIKIYIIILTIFSLLSLENARAAEAEIEKRVNNGDLSGYIEEISGMLLSDFMRERATKMDQ